MTIILHNPYFVKGSTGEGVKNLKKKAHVVYGHPDYFVVSSRVLIFKRMKAITHTTLKGKDTDSKRHVQNYNKILTYNFMHFKFHKEHKKHKN